MASYTTSSSPFHIFDVPLSQFFVADIDVRSAMRTALNGALKSRLADLAPSLLPVIMEAKRQERTTDRSRAVEDSIPQTCFFHLRLRRRPAVRSVPLHS